MYEWYQEYYVGAAHGLAGIYYYLMQVSNKYGEILLSVMYYLGCLACVIYKFLLAGT